MAIGLPALASLAALAATALSASAPPDRCGGKVTGSVTAKFSCVAEVIANQDGKPVFVITARDAIPDVPAFRPGAFELPSPPAAGTYRLGDLGMGLASLAAEGGTLYTAAKTSGQRGDVTLTLRSVKPDRERPGAFVVHGSYRARLVPTGGGKTGEVVVEVSF